MIRHTMSNSPETLHSSSAHQSSINTSAGTRIGIILSNGAGRLIPARAWNAALP
jgi:hypothetical protein